MLFISQKISQLKAFFQFVFSTTDAEFAGKANAKGRFLSIEAHPILGSAAASKFANLRLNLRQLALTDGQGGNGTTGGARAHH